MLKTNNLLKFFLILSPLLIRAEEKKETTPTVETAVIAEKEIAKKEKINFLNKKISISEEELNTLKIKEKTENSTQIKKEIEIKEADILNTKKELAALVSSESTFFKNLKEKLNTCKQKISNRTYLVYFGKTVGALALVASIGYAIKTYVEKKNTSVE